MSGYTVNDAHRGSSIPRSIVNRLQDLFIWNHQINTTGPSSYHAISHSVFHSKMVHGQSGCVTRESWTGNGIQLGRGVHVWEHQNNIYIVLAVQREHSAECCCHQSGYHLHNQYWTVSVNQGFSSGRKQLKLRRHQTQAQESYHTSNQPRSQV